MLAKSSLLAVSLVLLASVSVACKSLPSKGGAGDSKVESLAADEKSSTVNKLLAVGSPSSDEDFLPAVKLDVDSIVAPFQHRKIGFQAEVVYGNDYDKVIQETERIGREVGKDGTLIWVFSGHGYDAGELMIGREVLKFVHVAKALLRARGDVPLRRLVVIVDACYSGVLIEGDRPVTGFKLTGVDQSDDAAVNKALTQELLNQAIADLLPYLGGAEEGGNLIGSLFKEVIVLTSSRKTQKSNSHKDRGSQLLRAVNAAISDVTERNANYSIDQFLRRVVTLTERMNSEKSEDGKPLVPQNPLYRVLPAKIGTEPFASSRQP